MFNFLHRIFSKYPGVRYLCIGGFNTLMSLLVYYFLLLLHFNYLYASAITNVFGILEGFYLNSLIVFKHKAKLSGLLKYTSVYAISFILNLVLMYFWVDCLHISKFLAPIITIIILTVINYFLVKKFVFE